MTQTVVVLDEAGLVQGAITDSTFAEIQGANVLMVTRLDDCYTMFVLPPAWQVQITKNDSDDEPELKVSPRGYIQGVDYGPCFGGCVPELPCRQTQERHWYDNPANEKFVQLIKRG